MKILTITKASNLNNPGLIHLKNSFERLGYDYRIIHDPNASEDGNGHLYLSNWLKQNAKDYTHFNFTDAFDTLALGTPEEMKKLFDPYRIKYSGEKNCYPRGDWADKHEKGTSPWKYLNGGQLYAPIDKYLKFVETAERLPHENDQEWAMRHFLFNDKFNNILTVETKCEMYQSLYMESPGDFAWTRDGRLFNRITETYPIFVHGNGKIDMRWIYHPQNSPFIKWQ